MLAFEIHLNHLRLRRCDFISTWILVFLKLTGIRSVGGYWPDSVGDELCRRRSSLSYVYAKKQFYKRCAFCG